MIFGITNRESALIVTIFILCVSLIYMVYINYVRTSPVPISPVSTPISRSVPPRVKQKVCDEEMCYIKEEKEEKDDDNIVNVIPENTDTISEDDNIITIDEKEEEV